MRRVALVATLAVLAVAGAAYAFYGKAPVPEPPSWVSPDSWRSINADLGLVLTPRDDEITRGTIVVRVDDEWVPIVVQSSADLPARPLPAARE